jgi:hypothetical protein
MRRVLGLSAVPAVVFDGLVQSVIRLGDTALAAVIVIGVRSRRRRESQHACNCDSGQDDPAEELPPLSVKCHILHPPVLAPTGVGVRSHVIKHYGEENVARTGPDCKLQKSKTIFCESVQ